MSKSLRINLDEVVTLDNPMEVQDLKALIKESVREVLREERFTLCQVLMPSISPEEQAEIEAELGSFPDDNDEELADMTHWVKYGD